MSFDCAYIYILWLYDSNNILYNSVYNIDVFRKEKETLVRTSARKIGQVRVRLEGSVPSSAMLATLLLLYILGFLVLRRSNANAVPHPSLD